MPSVFEIGDVIAERRLTYEPGAGTPQQVTIRIGRPVLDKSGPHEAWFCPFQIEGIGSGKTRAIFGVDAMQALLLAIHTIPVELAVCIQDFGGQFLHFDEPEGSFVAACRMTIEHAGDEFPSRRR